MKQDSIEIKTRLSWLWVFVLFNWLYCDIMSLMDPTAAEGMKFAITPVFLLGASILMEIPIVMILVSKFAGYKAGRPANIAAAAIMALVQIASLFAGKVAIYYMFFSIIEIACTVFIAWTAMQWKQAESKDYDPDELSV
jgi:hypothetical protein